MFLLFLHHRSSSARLSISKPRPIFHSGTDLFIQKPRHPIRQMSIVTFGFPLEAAPDAGIGSIYEVNRRQSRYIKAPSRLCPLDNEGLSLVSIEITTPLYEKRREEKTTSETYSQHHVSLSRPHYHRRPGISPSESSSIDNVKCCLCPYGRSHRRRLLWTLPPQNSFLTPESKRHFTFFPFLATDSIL